MGWEVQPGGCQSPHAPVALGCSGGSGSRPGRRGGQGRPRDQTGNSRTRRAARKVPPAADAAADGSAADRPPLGEPKPVPGMGPEVDPAAEAHISLAPDAPSAENGASVVNNEAAADQGMLHGGEGEGAEGAAEPPAQPASVTPGPSGEPAAPGPARDNFIPQDSLPKAEGQGSPATSVGALDPLEQEREAEAEQKISSAAAGWHARCGGRRRRGGRQRCGGRRGRGAAAGDARASGGGAAAAGAGPGGAAGRRQGGRCCGGARGDRGPGRAGAAGARRAAGAAGPGRWGREGKHIAVSRFPRAHGLEEGGLGPVPGRGHG